ncbi:MAG: hypothetical protein JWR37_523 [Mycobacterium sp.]|nr:hypothetical protein [Mycobacterium sp.]
MTRTGGLRPGGSAAQVSRRGLERREARLPTPRVGSCLRAERSMHHDEGNLRNGNAEHEHECLDEIRQVRMVGCCV